MAQSQEEADRAARFTGRTSPTNELVSEAASDSEPSCDNFGEDEILHNFEIAMEAEEREREGELAVQHREKREKFTVTPTLTISKKQQ